MAPEPGSGRPPLTIRYEAGNGELTMEIGSQTITIDELGPLRSVVRLDDDDEARTAFFLSDDESDVLLKMVNYILGGVKIRPESKATLEALKPRLEALRES